MESPSAALGLLLGNTRVFPIPDSHVRSRIGQGRSVCPGDYRANPGSAVHGEVQLANATFSECLRFAFNVNNDCQISGPGWIKSRAVRFNIDAKAAPDTPTAQLRVMLQALLTERFQLALHHEPKKLSFLAWS